MSKDNIYINNNLAYLRISSILFQAVESSNTLLSQRLPGHSRNSSSDLRVPFDSNALRHHPAQGAAMSAKGLAFKFMSQ